MSKEPYTYEQFVTDLHTAINSKPNPRQTYNFLCALAGVPTAQPSNTPPDLLEAVKAAAKARAKEAQA